MGILKIIAFLFFVSLMLGFGTCGICGLAMGLSESKSNGGAAWIALLGLLGIALSVGCFFIVRAIGRSKPKQ
jgi:hypothetical protein